MFKLQFAFFEAAMGGTSSLKWFLKKKNTPATEEYSGNWKCNGVITLPWQLWYYWNMDQNKLSISLLIVNARTRQVFPLKISSQATLIYTFARLLLWNHKRTGYKHKCYSALTILLSKEQPTVSWEQRQYEENIHLISRLLLHFLRSLGIR